MKYILVTGGVISGIGKGVITSSIGTILKASGVRVTAIKIDPYINIDAGTFSPYEHGEVFVLDDGGEVDLDLGNYERFMDITLHRDNNITTGKAYSHVINKERRGDYLGKTVQVIPHITDWIQESVERVAHIPVDGGTEPPECCIIELGGTIGDIEGMPFVEAFRQLQFKVKPENFSCVHVSMVPEPATVGEQKTKPTQMSVRQLGSLGLTADLIMCRSTRTLDESVRNKLSVFCNVPPEQVFSVYDVSSIYRVPLLLEEQKVTEYFANRLKLPVLSARPKRFLTKWKDLADRHDNLQREVVIALVGKYTKIEDAYASVVKALNHASMHADRKLKLNYIESSNLEKATLETNPVKYHEAWQNLCKSSGVLVPGGFGDRGISGKLLAIEWARNNKKPFLGVCLGMQCAVIEFARNELKWEGANSTEMEPDTKHPVVIEMPEHNPGNLGGTMRLGKRKTIFNPKFPSLMKQLYGNFESIDERHRHRYEVNPTMTESFNKAGFNFVGHDEVGDRMEVCEIPDHPYFVGVQYHPEYLSRPMKPSPPYLGLIYASCGKLNSLMSRLLRATPSSTASTATDDSDSDTAQELATINTPHKPT